MRSTSASLPCPGHCPQVKRTPAEISLISGNPETSPEGHAPPGSLRPRPFRPLPRLQERPQRSTSGSSRIWIGCRCSGGPASTVLFQSGAQRAVLFVRQTLDVRGRHGLGRPPVTPAFAAARRPQSPQPKCAGYAVSSTSRPPERDQPCRIAALRSDHGVELRADQSHRDSAQFTVTRRGSSASPPSSWPGLTRPSTSLLCAHKKDVNDRLKRTMTIETFQGATRANAHSLLPADQRSTSGSSRICTGWHRSGSQTSPVPS